ncbi:MAG TPA: hypothetical protein VMU43_14745 [Candidatus Acidoferrum sp.]|nr:hypothetical protein [Candidatus Acidoferrum sp.]
MDARRDYIAEIEEIRDRTGPPDWDNGITKLLFLCVQSAKLETESEEVGYFPVATIAAIESYFRWEIRRLIDSGDARFINGLTIEELPLKLSHSLLIAVHGRRISLGELIGHSARLNNLDEINKTMSQLLGTDFLVLVKDARDPELRREQGQNAPTIITSANDTFESVKRTFELRHIICHEAHLAGPVRLTEAKQLCLSCYEFAQASRYGIAYYKNPDAPLTLEEACKAAKGRARVLDNEIRSVEAGILSTLPLPMQKVFQEMQNAWRLFVQRQAEFDASPHMNGNRGVLYEQLTIESLYGTRLNELKKYTEKAKGAAPDL